MSKETLRSRILAMDEECKQIRRDISEAKIKESNSSSKERQMRAGKNGFTGAGCGGL